MKTGIRHPPPRFLLHVRHRILRWKMRRPFSGAAPFIVLMIQPVKLCTGLNDQAVNRQVLRSQIQNFFQRFRPGFHGLPRQAVHQIHTDILKPGFPGLEIILPEIAEPVNTAKPGKLRIIRALKSQAEPVNSKGTVSFQLLPVQGTGIAFHCNLAVRCQLKTAMDGIHYPAGLFRIQYGGRSASQKYTDGASRKGPALCLLFQHLHILFPDNRVRRRRKEITVAAFPDAERNVDIHLQFPGICVSHHPV